MNIVRGALQQVVKTRDYLGFPLTQLLTVALEGLKSS